MKIFGNKFLILGTLVLLLISIPLTLFLIKRQQELRGRAAATSKLFFAPEAKTTSTQCQSFDMDIMVDPGSNFVSIVDFYITYDPTKLDVVAIKESPSFPSVNRPASISSGAANESVSIGSDITKTVQSVAKVATVTFKPKAEGQTQVQFDQTKSRVFSAPPNETDLPTENVLFGTTPGAVTINSAACAGATPGAGTGTPTVGPSPTGGVGGGIPTPTSAPSPTTALNPTVAPTTGANKAPTCTSLQVSPAATGVAPLAVLFTAIGSDPDAAGLIAKTRFNFGDGVVQDITEGMNLKNVTAQSSHTYAAAGTYAATVTFTDDAGAISPMCNQTITVTSSASATTSPTAAPTDGVQGKPTAAPTAVPTIPPSGGISTTLGVIGAVSLTIIVGFILLAL